MKGRKFKVERVTVRAWGLAVRLRVEDPGSVWFAETRVEWCDLDMREAYESYSVYEDKLLREHRASLGLEPLF